MNKKSIFQLDGRLANSKIIESKMSTIQKNPFFSAAATTGSGYLAVGSEKGEIRLYDKLGM
jgi:hypothetical protein